MASKSTRRAHFSPQLFRFLKDLKANNDRDWFQANRDRYEDYLKEAGAAFIRDASAPLARISKHFVADPKRSLFRIYRDTRFSPDKSPYKTHMGVQFRHAAGKDAHAPGFYLHLEPGGCFVGMGLWRPEAKVAGQIRDAIVSDPTFWKRATRGKSFRELLSMDGESLKRPPRGYPASHPLVTDLMRKDFVAMAPLTQKAVTSPELMDLVMKRFGAGKPFMRFLCRAVGAEF